MRLKYRALWIVTFVCLVETVARNALAVTVTGAELASHPSVSFFDNIPTVSGSAIIWGSGGPSYGKAVQIDLGPLEPDDVVRARFTFRRRTVDFDPIIALTDGSNLVGAQATDDNGGAMRGIRLDDIGSRGILDGHDGLISGGAGYADVGDTMDVEVEFSLMPSMTNVVGRIFSESGLVENRSRIIDVSAPKIGLVVVFDNEIVEETQIELASWWINPIDSSAIPEPSTFVLCFMSTVCLMMRRDRRATAW